jgi:hypothetical protein
MLASLSKEELISAVPDSFASFAPSQKPCRIQGSVAEEASTET